MFQQPRDDGRKTHWERVYQTKSDLEVSWRQDDPAVSLDLIRESVGTESRVIDVGGGSSVLAGRLLALGFQHVAVLDISDAALERAKARIGDAAGKVRWITADITAAPELGQYDLWHDRAVFHFLTTEAERSTYVELAARTVPTGGRLVIGTFALDGPEQGSGLPVERYDGQKLAAQVCKQFSLQRETQESHLTPRGKPQRFTYAVFARVDAEKADVA